MTKLLRIASAFIVAPIVAALAMMIGNAIHYGRFSFTDFKVVLLFSFLFGLAMGIPAFLVFRRLGWNQLWKYLIGGAVIGLIATYLILGIPFEFQPSVTYVWSVTLQYWELPFGGAIGAAVFWLIAVNTPKSPADFLEMNDR